LVAYLNLAFSGKNQPGPLSAKLTPKESQRSPTPLPPPTFSAPLELPEGTIKLQSPFYLRRPSDQIALETIHEPGVTITIKGPRQMGKSSLLVRVAAEAQKVGKRVALLDFQFFDAATLLNAEVFMRQFCAWLSYTLKIDDQSGAYWQLPLGNIQRCTSYLE